MQKTLGIFLVILLVAFSRILPHPDNVSPVVALGLLGGAYCLNVYQALLLVFGAMFISDAVIGFHPSLPAVYFSLALAVFIGRSLQENRKLLPIAAATLASSFLFFLITNFSAWLELPYTKDLNGLVQSYIAAVPFFRNSLLGDAFYTAMLFGGLYILESREESELVLSSKGNI